MAIQPIIVQMLYFLDVSGGQNDIANPEAMLVVWLKVIKSPHRNQTVCCSISVLNHNFTEESHTLCSTLPSCHHPSPVQQGCPLQTAHYLSNARAPP